MTHEVCTIDTHQRVNPAIWFWDLGRWEHETKRSATWLKKQWKRTTEPQYSPYKLPLWATWQSYRRSYWTNPTPSSKTVLLNIHHHPQTQGNCKSTTMNTSPHRLSAETEFPRSHAATNAIARHLDELLASGRYRAESLEGHRERERKDFGRRLTKSLEHACEKPKEISRLHKQTLNTSNCVSQYNTTSV